MSDMLNLYFDKGNGALFEVEHQGIRVRCFVSQDNAFLLKKANSGQVFPQIFERYERLIAEAAKLNVLREGVSGEPWGNFISEQDIEAAQEARRREQSN
jgi:hypothetical protein